MGERRMIKVIETFPCPHCSKEVSVSISSITPSMEWALRSDVVAETKARVMAEVSNMLFANEDRKKMFLTWLRDDALVFGPEEAAKVIEHAKEEATKK